MPPLKNPRLSDLQRWMRGIITHPKGVTTALNKATQWQDCIGETAHFSRAKRLDTYAYAYFSRIIDALGANYSSVKHVMGSENFQRMARAYLIGQPSTFKSIDDVGHLLPTFLKTWDKTKSFPFIADLARLEWAAHQAFFADDRPPLQPENLKQLMPAKWPNARFEMEPAMKLLKLNWPLIPLWRDDGQWKKQRLVRLKKKDTFVLIYRRPEKWVRMVELEKGAFELLQQLQQGKTLQQSFSALQRKHKAIHRWPVQNWFQSWMELGLVSKIVI